MQLPETARAALMALYLKKEQTARDYDIACNTVMAMLGLDPKLDHKLELTTGVVTPAVQEEQPCK